METETQQQAGNLQHAKPVEAKEIVSTPAKNALVFAGDLTLTQLAERHEKHQNIIRFALLQTEPHDWIRFGKEPYLEGTGAERIARYYGLSLGEPVYSIELKKNGHIYVECMAIARGGDREFYEIGDCSSDDPFFHRNGKEQDAECVNRADVKKKARENWKSRAVAGFFGLRGLKWEDLERISGGRIKADGSGAGVDFEKGKKGGSKETTDQRNTRVSNANTELEAYQNYMAMIENALTVSMSFDESEEDFCRAVSEHNGKSYANLLELKTACGNAFEKFKNCKLVSAIANRAKAHADKIKGSAND